MATPAFELARGRLTNEVSAKLNSVEWDFANASRDPIHGIHPYPAKFIAQIPRALIRLFKPARGLRVLDPFCGSGTSLVEAGRVGIPSIGIDLHPLACLIAKVKTRPPRNAKTVVASRAEELVEKAQTEDVDVPDIPRLDHWFMPHVQEVLARLIYQIDRLGDEDVRDALRVALSRIIVRVSNQESDTRYAAIEKDVTNDDVYSAFRRSAESVGVAIDGVDLSAPASVLNMDVLKVRPDDVGRQSIGLVVTSPPYPNAYEYWLYHKYRMWWLGMDPIEVRTHEIGARPHYFKKDPQTEHDFERQMGRCFELFTQVVAPSGLVCFVVGRSIIHGRTIDNAALLVRAARPHGFVPVGHAIRGIPRNRKTFNPDHGAIEKEQLVVFARDERAG